MNKTTNYLILFSCLLYLKCYDKNKDKNKDTIKILVSLIILFFVYQLFKTENFTGNCDLSSPSPIIPNQCLDSCAPSPSPRNCCSDQSEGNAFCMCDQSEGWKLIDLLTTNDQYQTKQGACYCDPTRGNCKNKYKCSQWTSLPSLTPSIGGCSSGTEIITENLENYIGSSPQESCCREVQDPCSSSPCGNGTCSASASGSGNPYTRICNDGYKKNAQGTTCVAQDLCRMPSPIEDYEGFIPTSVTEALLDKNSDIKCLTRSSEGSPSNPWYLTDSPDPVNMDCSSGGILTNPGYALIGSNDTPCNQFGWLFWLAIAGIIIIIILVVVVVATRRGSTGSETWRLGSHADHPSGIAPYVD